MPDKKDTATPAGVGKKPSPLIDLKATVIETTSPSVETRAAFANTTPAAKPAPTDDHAAAAKAKADTAKPQATKASASAGAQSSNAETSSHAPPMAAPARSRTGLFSHLLAGVAGGALALLGLSQVSPSLDGSGQRIADLEQKLAKLSAADPSPRIAPIDARLAKLEEAAQAMAAGQVSIASTVKAVEANLAKAAEGSLPAGSAERLAKLEEQLALMVSAANANPQSAGRVPQLAQLTGKIGEIETQLSTRTSELRSDLTRQMDQLFTKSTEALDTTRSMMNQRTQSVEQALKALTDEAASLRTGVDAVKVDLDRRFAAAAKPAEVQSAVASVATKVAALEKSMQGVVQSEQDRNATAGNILLSLELANLKRALDRGSKYASELAAVRKLAGDKLDLAVLEAQQNVGVPSLETLGKELAQIAHAMLDADTDQSSATVGDRILSGVKSMVRVRRVDFAPGDTSTEASIARMEIALKEGRINDAVEESKKLTPKATAAGSKVLDRIAGRAAIDRALATLDQSLKSSLAGGAAPKKVAN